MDKNFFYKKIKS